ncbi:MAG: hypothetical protein ACJAWV_001889 [Flammeovirgaceae bacterium]|jgi:hypothetical protein
MRKIDKSNRLATVYEKWESELESKKLNHPKYQESKIRNAHYNDIVANLLFCQNGLCAYTEIRLCDEKLCAKELWKDGKLTTDFEKFGHLEHFDESLKSKNADTEGRKDWLWDNLFFVHSDINTKVKGSKSVDTILKPDSAKYNPESLLQYDSEKSVFEPHVDLEESRKEQVRKMILTLGLNYGAVKITREKCLLERRKAVEFGVYELDEPIDQFPTAYEMSKPQWKLN